MLVVALIELPTYIMYAKREREWQCHAKQASQIEGGKCAIEKPVYTAIQPKYLLPKHLASNNPVLLVWAPNISL